jgi:hypothetical protein
VDPVLAEGKITAGDKAEVSITQQYIGEFLFNTINLHHYYGTVLHSVAFALL